MALYYCSFSDTKKMEKIQERALRFVYYDFQSSLWELRERAGVPILHVGRLRKSMCEVYKITNEGPGMRATLPMESVHTKENPIWI